MNKRSMLLYAAPLGILAILFSNVWSSWFFQDDFSWLLLNQELSVDGWWHVLTRPMAQGTFRPLSERAQFMVLRALFDLDATPHHVLAFLTQFANLLLLNIIARKLSGSMWIGFWAAALWSLNSALTLPLGWPSAYSQIMCGLFLLGALRLLIAYAETGQRRYNIAQWTVFLLGFGVQELNVVYPAIAAAYALLFARPFLRGTFALFVPSILYTALHGQFAPKASQGVYGLSIGPSIAVTLGKYSVMSLWPDGSREVLWISSNLSFLFASVLICGLLAVLAWTLFRCDKVALFGALWFVIVLSPFLLLPNHVSSYYLSVPTAGLGLLLACGLRLAWENGKIVRALAVVFLVVHLAASTAVAWGATAYNQRNSEQGQMVFFAVQEIGKKFPGQAIFIDGVDDELFGAIFYDHGFRASRNWQVYITPDNAAKLQLIHGLSDNSAYTLPAQALLYALNQQTAVVFSNNDGALKNVTSRYREKLQASSTLQSFPKNVKVGLAAFEYLLGPTWHTGEAGYRWMPKTADVTIGGPAAATEKLYINGFCKGATTPINFSVSLEGRELGRARIDDCEKPVAMSFALGTPAAKLHLHFEVDRVFMLPPDVRELGLAIEEITVR